MKIEKLIVPDHGIFEVKISAPAKGYIIPRKRSIEEWIEYLKNATVEVEKEDREDLIAALDRAVNKEVKLENFSNQMAKGEARTISFKFSFRKLEQLEAFCEDMAELLP